MELRALLRVGVVVKALILRSLILLDDLGPKVKVCYSRETREACR